MFALGDPYVQPDELADRSGRADDGSYPRLIDAASRRVEAFTRRQFNKTDEATTRLFTAVDVERLVVDDFYTTTDLAVVIDGVTWASDDYDLRPYNGIVNGEQGWPFYELLAVSRSWPIRRRATIEVTARWGWAAVPEGIAEATLRVAKVMVDSLGQSGLVSSETTEGYSVSYQLPNTGPTENVPHELMPALPYRRRRFGIA